MPLQMSKEEKLKAVEGKFYTVRMTCVCTAQDRSGGWGCCCSWPINISEDPQGEFMLVPREPKLWD